jgi:hypothetical protein
VKKEDGRERRGVKKQGMKTGKIRGGFVAETFKNLIDGNSGKEKVPAPHIPYLLLTPCYLLFALHEIRGTIH